MHQSSTFRGLGLLLSAYSLTMLPPMGVAFWYQEETVYVFLLALLALLLVGLCLWLPFRHPKRDPYQREGFLLVVSFWIVLCLVGALPYILSKDPDIGFVDALFESVSGFTATGATVMVGLDKLPRSILYYRQQTQFLGGMGIILLAVAILPALGIGGMQLFRAEFTGPLKDDKLTPRIAQSAKGIWLIYTGLAVFCAIAYWAAGMELFDAIGTSFGTISTGGFTTHDQSFAHFHMPGVQWVAIVFMVLGGANFALHFITAHYGGIGHYWRNYEFRSYIMLLAVASIVVILVLEQFHVFEQLHTTTVESVFHVVSLSTTTGFVSASYADWPSFIPILLLLLGVVGGCAGSTSGGIKIIRMLLLHKQGIREIHRLIHPNAQYVIKFGQSVLSDKVINAIWGFLATYFALYGLFFLLFLACDMDFITAYSATAAALSNIGPGLGEVAKNYQEISDPAKLLFSFAMLIGRLELFTVLVLFTPTYWRA